MNTLQSAANALNEQCRHYNLANDSVDSATEAVKQDESKPTSKAEAHIKACLAKLGSQFNLVSEKFDTCVRQGPKQKSLESTTKNYETLCKEYCVNKQQA